jgi:hypothetical protein
MLIDQGMMTEEHRYRNTTKGSHPSL